MYKQSGICIKSKDNRSIFLLKNGQFVKGTPVGNPLKGEEVLFYPDEKRSVSSMLPTMAPITAAIAMMVLFMSSVVFPAEEAYGYVQVQVNPGVELGINEEYEVVSVRQLNSDGHELIHQLGDWENNSLQTVLNRVLELAVTDQTRNVTITAVEEDGKEFDQTIRKVVLSLSLEIENDLVAIQMKEATKEQWRDAKKEQVPVGQMIKKSVTVKNQVEPKEQLLEQDKMPVSTLQVKEQHSSKEKNSIKKPKEETEKRKETSDLPEEKKEDKSLKEKQQQKTPTQKSNAKESSTAPNNAPVAKPEKEIKPTKTDPKDKLIKKEEKKVEKQEKQEKQEEKVEKKVEKIEEKIEGKVEKKIEKNSKDVKKEKMKTDSVKGNHSINKEENHDKRIKDEKDHKNKSEGK
ncbi:hypothetical protein [Planococcus donghaensis]|uniref:RsgI N-terminal anti-sigma domain-containing protein n=1 Tax=Planococcus donghaensis TaxID=414778 RepID=A0A1C7EFW2_9BACL|nr:hypothetical protein [Planococcus donghaensis]ANU22740.1 hypothetical protein BCM40_04930 [Planococcus donghaensis]